MARIPPGYSTVAQDKIAPSLPPKETAADFARRELAEIIQRLETVSNRLSAAKKRLQDHFGVPTTESAQTTGQGIGVGQSPGMDGVRRQLDDLDSRLHSIADGLEELI